MTDPEPLTANIIVAITPNTYPLWLHTYTMMQGYHGGRMSLTGANIIYSSIYFIPHYSPCLQRKPANPGYMEGLTELEPMTNDVWSRWTKHRYLFRMRTYANICAQGSLMVAGL